MDVHAPHEPVHTWRDFIAHIAIMTIGLFIALMLESLVEYAHHRHIVHQARENIRRELENNRANIREDMTDVGNNEKQIQADIDKLEEIRNTHILKGSINNVMTFRTMDTSAWRTARDTGALAYMPYDEVQQYSDIYMEADAINTRSRAISEDQFKVLGPMLMKFKGDVPPDAEIDRMMLGFAESQIAADTQKQFLEELDDSIKDALKAH